MGACLAGEVVSHHLSGATFAGELLGVSLGFVMGYMDGFDGVTELGSFSRQEGFGEGYRMGREHRGLLGR